MHPW